MGRTAARVLRVAAELTGRRGGTLRLRRAGPALTEGLEQLARPEDVALLSFLHLDERHSLTGSPSRRKLSPA